MVRKFSVENIAEEGCHLKIKKQKVTQVVRKVLIENMTKQGCHLFKIFRNIFHNINKL